MPNKNILNNLQREGLSLASTKSRALSFIVDDLIVSSILVAGFSSHFTGISTLEEALIVSRKLLAFKVILSFFYQFVFIHLYAATPGKIWQKIIVVQEDDFYKPSLARSAIRAATRTVSEIIFFYGFITAFLSPLKKTWHDYAGKTIVINA